VYGYKLDLALLVCVVRTAKRVRTQMDMQEAEHFILSKHVVRGIIEVYREGESILG
jgi:hypothetical protein